MSTLKNKTRPLSLATYKINSKYIKNVNVQLKTIKLLEENIEEMLRDIGTSKNFFVENPKAQKTK
jgi:hypothetical protein